MIVYSAIVPHSPLLMPTIGKEHRDKLSKTLDAIKRIEHGLYLSKPDTVIIIAPHGALYPDAFSINLSPSYTGNFQSFGDFTTTIKVKSDFLLIDHIQRLMREAKIPFTLTSSESLEYGFNVPWFLLGSQMTAKLIPISPSQADGKAHLDFGRHLKRVLHAEPTRVAIIASADLAHKSGKDISESEASAGSEFDTLIETSLRAHTISTILNMDTPALEKVKQCGYRPIMTLLGILDEVQVRPEVLSYEAPFGVGYITVSYDIH